MRTEAATDYDTARQLEQYGAAYPDERGEVLLEAAEHHHRAGATSRALDLLNTVIADGGVDAEYAHASLAEIHFEQGADDDARAQLTAYQQAGPTDAGPAGLAAELLEERGDYESAQHWYDVAIGLLSDGERAALGGVGDLSFNATLLWGRQRCRQQLGLPEDDTDRLANAEERNRLAFVDEMESASQLAWNRPVQVLIWQHDQRLQAAQRWPAVFTADVIGHHTDVEARLREATRSSPISTVTLVPGDVDDFAAYLERTGGDPADEQTRLAYSSEVYDQGGQLPWPPGRNKPCWCGSNRKYKKCCGAPQRTT